MSQQEPAGPFDTIESAEAFLELLNESIEEAAGDVEVDLMMAKEEGPPRRVEAVTLALHKLDRLSFHVGKSRRLLNDLRMLRRLLVQESEQEQKAKLAGVGV